MPWIDAAVAFSPSYLNLYVALASALFAAVTLASGRRRLEHRLLAAFLLLIAVNQTMEGCDVVQCPPAPWGFVVGSWGAALDPVLLYAFAILLTGSTLRAHRRTLTVGGMAAAGLVLATLAAAKAANPYNLSWFAFLLYAYTALFYLLALRLVALRLRRADAAQSYGLFLVALGLATVPSVARAAWVAGIAWGLQEPWTLWARIVATLVTPVLASAWILAAGRRTRPGARAFFAVGAIGGSLLAWLIYVRLVAALVTTDPTVANSGGVLLQFELAGPPIRWLLFGALASIAVVRYRLLDLSLANRRRAARAFVGLAFFGLAALIILVVRSVATDQVPSLRPLDWALLIGVLLATQGLRNLVDRAAFYLYGVPPAGDRLAAVEAYRLAALQCAAEGRTPEQDPSLRRLRDELGLDAAATSAIERVVEMTHAGPLTSGRLVAGRYRIQRLLGRGGSGRTFLARDERLKRDVALKEVVHEADEGPNRALEEARVAGSQGHPNIVTVYDLLPGPDASLIITEFVGGGSLAQRLSDRSRMSNEVALRVSDGMLAGLESLHGRGFVHGDLKPANVLLAPDGTPKIADFGLARFRGASTGDLGRPTDVRGTPGFLAPEQLEGKAASPASDVYAVGQVLRLLFPAATPAVGRVIDRALARNVDQRWRSAAALRKALREATGRLTRGTTRASARPRRGRRSPKDGAAPS